MSPVFEVWFVNFVQVSLEDGTVKGFDIRNATTETSSESKASFTLHAHEKAVCSVSYNPLAPNVLCCSSLLFSFLLNLSLSTPLLCVASFVLITNFCLSLLFSSYSRLDLLIKWYFIIPLYCASKCYRQGICFVCHWLKISCAG